MDISPYTPEQLLLGVLITLVAGLVQGTLGFGFAIVSVPLLTLVNPSYTPIPQLLLTVPMTLYMAWRERRYVDLRGLGWILVGRVPGTLTGRYLLHVASRPLLDGLIAGIVFFAVLALALGRAVRRTNRTQFAAGYLSGVMGITSAIGGPPLALLFKDERGPTIRANLAAIFALGVVFSLLVLGTTGGITEVDLRTAAMLFPSLAMGIFASRWLMDLVEGRWLRVGILVLAGIAAVSLATRTLSKLLGVALAGTLLVGCARAQAPEPSASAPAEGRVPARVSATASAATSTSPPKSPELSTPKKQIALSFDDAPRGKGPRFSGDERGAELIAALERVQAGPVVFFITTQGFAQQGGRARVERYAAAGHLIANHSHSHRWLRKTAVETYLADIDRASKLLEGIENQRSWYRFPFLDEGKPLKKRDAVRAGLKQRGLKNGYVTIDNYDWYIEREWLSAVKAKRSVDEEALKGVYIDMLLGAVRFYDAAAREALGRSPAHVLLLHENDLAALFIDDLVLALRKEGWKIVSPDVAYADPIAKVQTKTLMNYQGHVAALAVEAGRDPKTFTHRAIEEAQLDAFLRERKVFGSK